MRVVKEAEERKNEILDVAEVLFASKGYDNTSTNDILKEVNIARGTLYYHFKSKEDILDAIISRMETALIGRAKAVASDRSIPILERMTMAIQALNVDSNIGSEVLAQVHKPQNALMHQKMQESLIKGVVPIITELCIEGVEAGILNTDYPAQAVEMIMIYSSVAFDDRVGLSPDELMLKVTGFIANTERILGAKPGSMSEAILKLFA